MNKGEYFTGRHWYSLMMLLLLASLPGHAQSSGSDFGAFLNNPAYRSLYPEVRVNALQSVYKSCGNRFIWLADSGKIRLKSLKFFLTGAALRANDGVVSTINLADSLLMHTGRLASRADSLRVEFRLTDQVLSCLKEIGYVAQEPGFGYVQLPADLRKYKDAPAALVDLVNRDDFSPLDRINVTRLAAEDTLARLLERLEDSLGDPGYKEKTLSLHGVKTQQGLLEAKLVLWGILPAGTGKLPEDSLRQAIRKAQVLFNLPPTGKWDNNLVQALNVPLTSRIVKLRTAINYLKWIGRIQSTRLVLVVNIPAAYLKVYQGGKVLLDMKAVVGKPRTPSPTLVSSIETLVLYPYWNVPRSIVIKELLPKIQRNLSFIDEGGYEILDGKGRRLNPYDISWSSYSGSNFPYQIRQSTGCDNSLGVLKFDFYSPFGVYLHDTPFKSLFNRDQRFFSHGCIRLEHAVELAHLLAPEKLSIVDGLLDQGCLEHQEPVLLPLKNPAVVVVGYNLVDLDAAGNPVFYRDVYHKQ